MTHDTHIQTKTISINGVDTVVEYKVSASDMRVHERHGYVKCHAIVDGLRVACYSIPVQVICGKAGCYVGGNWYQQQGIKPPYDPKEPAKDFVDNE